MFRGILHIISYYIPIPPACGGDVRGGKATRRVHRWIERVALPPPCPPRKRGGWFLYPFMMLLTWLVPLPAAATTPIVADLSNYRIDIDARFIGTRLFLFGSRNENGDIVVVVRGPHQKYTVRRKERVLGMWVNRHYVTFNATPEFFALSSSRPLESLSHPNLIKQLNIDPANLLTVDKVSSHNLDIEQFKTAFLDSQHDQLLYNDPTELQFMGESLFKTTLHFPDIIPKGNYTAEVYLLQDDTLIATQSIPIVVRKVGLDGMITTLAHELPWLYGIIAILVALSAGWIANRVFQRL